MDSTLCGVCIFYLSTTPASSVNHIVLKTRVEDKQGGSVDGRYFEPKDTCSIRESQGQVFMVETCWYPSGNLWFLSVVCERTRKTRVGVTYGYLLTQVPTGDDMIYSLWIGKVYLFLPSFFLQSAHVYLCCTNFMSNTSQQLLDSVLNFVYYFYLLRFLQQKWIFLNNSANRNFILLCFFASFFLPLNYPWLPSQ